MAVPRCAWGRSRRTPVPTPHSEGQPPRLATPAVGPLRHLDFLWHQSFLLYRTTVRICGPQNCTSTRWIAVLMCGFYSSLHGLGSRQDIPGNRSVGADPEGGQEATDHHATVTRQLTALETELKTKLVERNTVG